MINLLPPQGKKALVTEYYTRLAVISLIFLALAGLILIALSLPVFVLIRSQLNAYANTYSETEAKIDSYADSVAQVQSANALATELNRQLELPPMLPYLDKIDTLAGDSISINTINMKRTASGQIEAVTIGGSAATRSSLAAFRDKIEADAAFATAALPLSNLAKDKDLPFTITITTASPTTP